MPDSRLLLLLLVALSVLTLAACEDPTSVGRDIIGDRGGEPVVVEAAPTTFEQTVVPQITGNSVVTLVGHLDDEVLGRIRSNAYIDFSVSSVPSDFRSGTVSSASLLFDRSYLAGDTLGDVTFRLFDMEESWNGQGATGDTSFVRGPEIGRFTISAADTIARVRLPDDWVARNDTTLRSSSFGSVFHGFYLEGEAGNTIYGISSSSRLQAIAGADTAHFGMAQNVTVVDHDAADALPEDRLIVQAASGLAIDADFNLDTLRTNFAVNRATLTMREDSLLSRSNMPPNYVRPRAQELDLYARLESGSMIHIATAVSDAGNFTFRTSTLLDVIDQIARGALNVDTFVLRVPTTPNSLDHLLIRTDSASPPRLTLTVTPLLD